RFTRACMDVINAYRHPPDVVVGARFDRAAKEVVKATPKYWLPPDDPRQTSLPFALVDAEAGDIPGTVSAEKKAHWETTSEDFMNLVIGRGSPPQSSSARVSSASEETTGGGNSDGANRPHLPPVRPGCSSGASPSTRRHSVK